jgi:hypothetical protein
LRAHRPPEEPAIKRVSRHAGLLCDIFERHRVDQGAQLVDRFFFIDEIVRLRQLERAADASDEIRFVANFSNSVTRRLRNMISFSSFMTCSVESSVARLK